MQLPDRKIGKVSELVFNKGDLVEVSVTAEIACYWTQNRRELGQRFNMHPKRSFNFGPREMQMYIPIANFPRKL